MTPSVLGVRSQARVVNNLLRRRLHELLPGLMRESGFDMWLIVCWEDNYDPVFKTMVPWDCWAPILQILVFFDEGEPNEIERLNISLTDLGDLMRSEWSLDVVDDQWSVLRRVIEERNPRRIGINESPVFWAADGLSSALKAKLVETLGEEFSRRLESAEQLAIRWLETRLGSELELYEQACAVAHDLISSTFTRTVVTPGVTTTDDLRWHYWQAATDLGLPVSFPPFFRIHRSPENRELWGGDDVVHAGDMVHCDVGVKYLRLLTDHQELAYVLRPGESAAPEGLRRGLAEANRLQEIFIGCWAEGATGNEILAVALSKARQRNVSGPKIYSHSLSHYLHEPGPLMGLPWEQSHCPGRGDVAMRYDTCYTVELSVTAPVPEWGGEPVTFALEQDACFSRDGVRFIDGRQTDFHLI